MLLTEHVETLIVVRIEPAEMNPIPYRPTQIVMLGTGTPMPDPDRSGPSTAIVVNDTPYLIDFGPGVVRRAAAAYRKGVTAFGEGAVNITTVFLTHLHTDHTVGYPDLIFTPWVMGRKSPLSVYGPAGLNELGLTCANPAGAFYAFPDVTRIHTDSRHAADILLDRAQVATVPGIVFGTHGEGHLRFSFSTSLETIQAGLDSLRRNL